MLYSSNIETYSKLKQKLINHPNLASVEAAYIIEVLNFLDNLTYLQNYNIVVNIDTTSLD